ncbi:MAG: alpha/beta fold hydrolase [Candidatus Hydrogenedentes bacterium]|nr:alpha/beta fold hydrolase [Candidatus Hydrogenedentota bacterium]
MQLPWTRTATKFFVSALMFSLTAIHTGCGADQAALDPFLRGLMTPYSDLNVELVSIPPNGVPAYAVYQTAKKNDVKPAVIVLHGGEAGDADKNQPFTWYWPQELARLGYYVVCPDAWGCGAHPGVADFKAMTGATFFTKLAPRVLNTADDNLKILDWLQEQPGVDGEKVAVIGISAGAVTTLATAMKSDRFSTFVAVSSLSGFLSKDWESCWLYQLQGITDVSARSEEEVAAVKSFDAIHHLDAIARKPLLLVHGESDQLAPPLFAQRLHEKLLPLYAERPDALRYAAFDAYPMPKHRAPEMIERLVTHAPSPAMTAAVMAWLENHLK